jgi:two-component system cell cycle response regulator
MTASPHPQPVRDRAWVLVVDDDQHDCMLAFRLLEREGHHATVADNPPAALRLLAEEPYDLVLLDLAPPAPDRYALLAAIKGDEGLRHIPVIATGPATEAGVVARCLELGAEDYLSKPFEPVLVRAKVGASLTRKRLEAQLADYVDAVSHLAEAASAPPGEDFDAVPLTRLARRPGPVGQLARAVLWLATDVRTDTPASRRRA